MIISIKKGLIIFIISYLFLSGCDYKLRDSYQGLNNLIVSISFDESNINQDFVDTLKRHTGLKKIYLNKTAEDTNLKIKILDHKVTRYSSAIGVGARTKEARMEYHLKMNLNLKGRKDNFVLEFKDNSNYSFDESRILAIEEVEKKLKENFFKNAIKRINFSLLNLLNEIN
tara:strand:+ start:731 stop:1243 length:513 start_codon:yes stop_codon:yes gene_type:complete